jgi:hypothetical protein
MRAPGRRSGSWSGATASGARVLQGTARFPSSQRAFVSDRPIVLAKQRELETVARLGMVPVRLRLEEVMPRHAVVVGDDLTVLLRAEELFLQEDALRPAVVTDSGNIPEGWPAMRVGDLPQPTPHVDALHVGNRCGVKFRGEIPVGAAKVDVVLDRPPAPQRGDVEEVLPRPRLGLVGGVMAGSS